MITERVASHISSSGGGGGDGATGLPVGFAHAIALASGSGTLGGGSSGDHDFSDCRSSSHRGLVHGSRGNRSSSYRLRLSYGNTAGLPIRLAYAVRLARRGNGGLPCDFRFQYALEMP